MTHAEAFLAAVLEAPGDDAPRLVFADWLDEHGGDPARAELIRLGVFLARYDCTAPLVRGVDAGEFGRRNAYDCGRCGPCLARVAGRVRRTPFRRREAALLAEHGGRWFAPHWTLLPVAPLWLRENAAGRPAPAVHQRRCRLFLRRGFVMRAELTEDALLAHGGRLLAGHPIRQLVLVGRHPSAYLFRDGDIHWSWDTGPDPMVRARARAGRAGMIGPRLHAALPRAARRRGWSFAAAVAALQQAARRVALEDAEIILGRPPHDTLDRGTLP